MIKKLLVLCQDYDDYYACENEVCKFFINKLKEGYANVYIHIDNYFSEQIYLSLKFLQTEYSVFNVIKIFAPIEFIEKSKQNKPYINDNNQNYVFPIFEENILNAKTLCDISGCSITDQIVAFCKDKNCFKHLSAIHSSKICYIDIMQ